MSQVKLKITKRFFNDKFFPYLYCQCPLQIIYGGASSGKSAFAAQRRIIAMCTEPRNYLIIRNVSNTLRSSIYTETIKAINTLKIAEFFTPNVSTMEITYFDGRKLMFRGLDDVEKLKSITAPVGTLTDIEIEEATEISENSFDQLELRMRGKAQCSKRICLYFNPIYNTHWIMRRFFKGRWIKYYYDKEMLIIHSTHLDNAFLDPQDHARIEAKTGYFHDVYAKGKPGILGDTIFTNWKVMDLSGIKEQFNVYRFGGDFGFTNDPTAIVRLAIDKRKKTIYWLDEIYEHRLTNDKILSVGRELVGSNVIWWDCAEPKSIIELQNGTEILTLDVNGENKKIKYSMNAEPVKKGKDSVLFGIQWMQQWNHVIDTRCQNTINEFTTFQWVKNKEGQSVNQPKGEDHAITAGRYALEQDMLYGDDLGMSTSAEFETEPENTFDEIIHC